MSKIFEGLGILNQSRPLESRTQSAPIRGMETSDRQRDLRATGGSNTSVMTAPAPPPELTSKKRLERRKQRRACVSLPVRLSSANIKDKQFDQVLETVNSCREGLYFTTASNRFYERMQLRIVFPYTSSHDAVPASESYGEVLRLDRLPDGRLGIAVMLQKGPSVKQRVVGKAPAGLVRGAGERRATTRQPFSAEAMLVDNQSAARMQGRCSDLSVAGCYIDTINPFPEGLAVRLRLSCGQGNFETDANVCFSHNGMGMGLVFCELTPDQEMSLVEWLENGGEPESPVSKPPVVSEPLNLSSMTDSLAMRLIRLLRAKGSISEAEVSALISVYPVSDEELTSRPCSDRL